MSVYKSIKKLVIYGVQTGLMDERDVCYTINRLISVLNLDDYADEPVDESSINLESVLSELLDYAVSQNICQDTVTYRDLFDTKLMSCLMPRPSEVTKTFWEKYADSPIKATEYYYKLSCDSDYIRRYRIEKDKKWVYSSLFGDLDITINLSKPEKDPKAIAAAKSMTQSSYPKCMLCKENEGYAGRVNSPARQNHRIIPLTLSGGEWFMQYSPYVYYNEHCIVFNSEHIPMKIDRTVFEKLFDFVRIFPHYFIGSNADLPIVGGSILSHEHFQGGNYEFAMAKAPFEFMFTFSGFEDVESGVIKWPMSAIRLKCSDSGRLVELSDMILKSWRGYSDEESFIYAETDGEPHNTITPIARYREWKYEIDLVLRNNLTTDEHPLGVFHPHAELHNIKKENIGLIEVMGLAVLPSRLDSELELLGRAICNGTDIGEDEVLSKHCDWVESFINDYDCINDENIDDILRIEVGKVFLKVLEHSGVFKCDEKGKSAFFKFLESVGS